MSVKYKELGKNYRAKKQDTIINNKDDYFPTYHALTRLLLDNISIKETTVLEPCAGAGDISKIVREYYPEIKIDQCDINPKANYIVKCNFLTEEFENIYGKDYQVDNVISNFPFNLFQEFLEKCTRICKDQIFVIAPLDYLHGVERFEKIFYKGCNGFSLNCCWVLVRRPLFDSKWRADGLMPTGATSFCWYQFSKYKQGGLIPIPVIKWLHNNEQMGTPTEVDQILFTDLIKE